MSIGQHRRRHHTLLTGYTGIQHQPVSFVKKILNIRAMQTQNPSDSAITTELLGEGGILKDNRLTPSEKSSIVTSIFGKAIPLELCSLILPTPHIEFFTGLGFELEQLTLKDAEESGTYRVVSSFYPDTDMNTAYPPKSYGGEATLHRETEVALDQWMAKYNEVGQNFIPSEIISGKITSPSEIKALYDQLQLSRVGGAIWLACQHIHIGFDERTKISSSKSNMDRAEKLSKIHRYFNILFALNSEESYAVCLQHRHGSTPNWLVKETLTPSEWSQRVLDNKDYLKDGTSGEVLNNVKLHVADEAKDILRNFGSEVHKICNSIKEKHFQERLRLCRENGQFPTELFEFGNQNEKEWTKFLQTVSEPTRSNLQTTVAAYTTRALLNIEAGIKEELHKLGCDISEHCIWMLSRVGSLEKLTKRRTVEWRCAESRFCDLMAVSPEAIYVQAQYANALVKLADKIETYECEHLDTFHADFSAMIAGNPPENLKEIDEDRKKAVHQFQKGMAIAEFKTALLGRRLDMARNGGVDEVIVCKNQPVSSDLYVLNNCFRKNPQNDRDNFEKFIDTIAPLLEEKDFEPLCKAISQTLGKEVQDPEHYIKCSSIESTLTFMTVCAETNSQDIVNELYGDATKELNENELNKLRQESTSKAFIKFIKHISKELQNFNLENFIEKVKEKLPDEHPFKSYSEDTKDDAYPFLKLVTPSDMGEIITSIGIGAMPLELLAQLEPSLQKELIPKIRDIKKEGVNCNPMLYMAWLMSLQTDIFPHK